MRRKIPTRRRKVKDVSLMIEKRNIALKNRMNSPPNNTNEQSVSRSFKEFMKLKMLAKEDTNKKIMTKTKNQGSYNETFNKTKITDAVSKTTKCNSPRNCELNKVSGKFRKANKFRKLLIKKRAKFIEKKNEKQLDIMLNEKKKDVIAFGEVVHRPPEITVRPRKVAVSNFVNRPGRKDDLLLKSLLKKRI